MPQPAASFFRYFCLTIQKYLAAKIFHIILSIAVFFSTTGFTLSRHFCQNELANTAIFVKSGCHKSTHKACAESGHCGKHQDGDKNNCCNDEAQYFKLNQEKQAPSASGIDFIKKPELLAAVLVAFQIEMPVTNGQHLTFQVYKPPIVCDDFQSLLQTFRL